MTNAGLEPANYAHWDAVWIAFKLRVRGRKFRHRRPKPSDFEFSGERIANGIWMQVRADVTEDSATAESLRSIGLDVWARDALHRAARRVDREKPFDKE